MPGDKVKASAIFAEAFRLEGEVKRLTKERDEARTALEAMKDRDYEPIKKWIQNDAPEAVRRAYAIMAKAESERDAAREALAAARRECEEANARCAMLDGHFSDAVRVAQEVKADLAAARLETDALKTATRNLINAAEALREGMIPTLYDEDLTKSRMVEHLRKLPNLLNASAKAAAEARAALAAPAAGRDSAIDDADAAWRDGEAHGRDE